MWAPQPHYQKERTLNGKRRCICFTQTSRGRCRSRLPRLGRRRGDTAMIRSDLRAPLALSASGCRNRQASLRDALRRLGADAGLIVDPGHMSYFFGYHQRPIFPVAGIVLANGPAVVCQAEILPAEATADETLTYRANILSTQEDNLATRVEGLVVARLKGIERIACDSAVGRGVLGRPCC